MKKYVLFLIKLAFVIAVLIAGGILADHIRAQLGRGSGGPRDDYSPAGQIALQPTKVSVALEGMITEGHAVENLTFTGAQTPDDVLSNGTLGAVFSNGTLNIQRINAKDLLPPPEDCSPPCSSWKFLPAAKKDYGWYVYGVGTPATDIIAYLPNITPALCSAKAKKLYYKSIPKQAGEAFDPEKPGVYSAKGSATTIKPGEDDTPHRPSEGCFDNHVGDGASNFAYYYVMYAQ